MEFTESELYGVVLKQEGVEFALFDSSLVVTSSSPGLAKRILENDDDHVAGLRLMDLFPDLCGMQKNIRELMLTQESMVIPRINYINKEYSYVDIQILPASEQLLVIWKDTSAAGVLEQKIIQQRNEMALLNRKLEKAYRMLGDLSGIDDLTKLLNRQAATHVFQHRISQAQRRKIPLSVFFIDVNKFKEINDEYGHDYGDQALSFVGDVIHRNVRSEDVAARWGGDEFVILSSDMNAKGSERISTNLVSVFENTPCVFLESGTEIFIQISIGVCLVNPDILSAVGLKEMVTAADSAMYQSKKQGGNSVVFCEIDEFGKINQLSLKNDPKFT